MLNRFQLQMQLAPFTWAVRNFGWNLYFWHLNSKCYEFSIRKNNSLVFSQVLLLGSFLGFELTSRSRVLEEIIFAQLTINFSYF
jgi:hypothetical protein